jgi:cytochrome P450
MLSRSVSGTESGSTPYSQMSALSDYAPRIEEFTRQFLDRLREEEGKYVPLLNYMTYYAYDVLAALAFGKPMGFINGEANEFSTRILKLMTSSLTAFGLLHHMPWLMNTLGIITSLAGPLKEWKDFTVNQMEARIAVSCIIFRSNSVAVPVEGTNMLQLKDAKPDMVTHLIDNTPNNGAGRALLHSESRLTMSAGSETISSALTFVFMQLATQPAYMQALRKEIRANEATYHCEGPLPLLDAVIQESMRLWPSVYFASQRVTPPEGLTIGTHFIPGNMLVQIPPFVLNRDPRNFVNPDKFIPERWLDRPELVLWKDAFMPFSTGPYNCAGKGLAMMELRSMISRVVKEFDVVLPDDCKEEIYWGGIRDHFTAGPPKQNVKFVKV